MNVERPAALIPMPDLAFTVPYARMKSRKPPWLTPSALLFALALSACAGAPGTGSDDGGPVTLLSGPIEGARISRGFGMRRHPILGYRRMHRGVDYVVPRGTAVRATGAGVVELAGWHGSYGRYIRIRHSGGIRTSYAHLSYIADTVRQGARVTIGAVIGRTGSSGLSTGPHLHYEVWRGDVAIDPSALHRQRQIVLRAK
jgi:murein DD-endopeptidase MepM/ murein hydrolase activator NlpD